MTDSLKTRIISAFIVLSASMPTAHAFDFEIGGVYYNIAGNQKSVTVTYGDLSNPTYQGDVFIPNEVTYRMVTYPVKAIDDLAFFYCQDITSVRIPDAVTQIGSQAFSHCVNLSAIQLPEKLQRLGDYSFENCESITEITIPAATTQIGFAAFTYCRALEKFSVDEANPLFAAVDGVLMTKTIKNLIQYPAAKTDSEFSIPETVTTIPDGAFSPQPYLRKISIGPALTKITEGLFAECQSLQDIDVDSANEGICSVNGVLFDKEVKTLIQYPVCHDEREYSLPNTVEALADLSMLGAKYIGQLTLPATLTKIGTYALTGCTGLTEVICLATNPPVTETNPLNTTGAIFDSQVYQQATLQVPEESVSTYRANKEWGKFSAIYEIGGSSLSEVSIAPDHANTYDLSGRKVHNPIPGRIYITHGKKFIK